jgi:hypothetical protein
MFCTQLTDSLKFLIYEFPPKASLTGDSVAIVNRQPAFVNISISNPSKKSSFPAIQTTESSWQSCFFPLLWSVREHEIGFIWLCFFAACVSEYFHIFLS